MSKGAFFSGLVGGLGRSLGSGYERKRIEEANQRQDMFRLLSSALMNDDQLPGSARREGFRQLGKNFGTNIPEELIEQIVPDVPIETDQFYAEMPPSPNPVTVRMEMPQSPFTPSPSAMTSQQAPSSRVIGAGQQAQLGEPPPGPGGQQQSQHPRGQQPQGQQQQNVGGDFGLNAGLMPMPRNPMTDQPQVIGVQAPNEESTFPVVQQRTTGQGATYDDLDLQMRIKHLENQLTNPPSRFKERIKQSSLGMSRAQIAEMRAKRLGQEQREMEMAMDNYGAAMKVKQAREEQIYQMKMEGPLMQAKLQAVQQTMGRQLTEAEKGRMMGINPTGQELQRQLEAEDYSIVAMGQKDSPEYKAAYSRITENERRNAYMLSQIQENAAQIKAQMANAADPMTNPRLINAAKVNSAKQASVQFTMLDQQNYIESRTKYWEDQLATAPQNIPGLDASWAALAGQQNPQARRAKAVELASKDAAGYKQRLADAIFQYSFPDGDQVVTLAHVRRRAEEAARRANDPNYNKNKLSPEQLADGVWTYWKTNGIILDENLDIWVP